jgi:sRNA-binding protein
MYLQSLVAGAARVDLNGEVTVRDAEYAAAKLAEVLAERKARQAAAVGTAQGARPATAVPPAAKTPKKRPVLRLPTFRQ